MAVDRLSGDELEEASDSPPEKSPEHGLSHVDDAVPRQEMGETRTPAEYYLALRAAVDQQGRAPTGPTSQRTSGPDLPGTVWRRPSARR